MIGGEFLLRLRGAMLYLPADYRAAVQAVLGVRRVWFAPIEDEL